MHAPVVSVREQAEVVVDRLRRQRAMTFRADLRLVEHVDHRGTLPRIARVVSRRRGRVRAVDPLGELTIRWTGADDAEWAISDEFDETYDNHRDGSMSDHNPDLSASEVAMAATDADKSVNVAGALKRCCCWPPSQ